MYGAVALRDRLHTPGAGYRERAEIHQGSGGSVAGLAIQDKLISLADSVVLDGSFNSKVDWALVGVEIKPGGAIPQFSLSELAETISLQ